jgi:hypothetical protein
MASQNDKQITVEVPEDRVPDFYAFFARFLAAGEFTGRGRRGYRGPGGPGRHGRGGHGRCGHHHPEHQESTAPPAAEAPVVDAPSAEPAA